MKPESEPRSTSPDSSPQSRSLSPQSRSTSPGRAREADPAPLKPGSWDGSRVVKATLPRLQEILEAQGLTNGDVARGTQIAHAQISRIFSGKQGMSLTSALRIAGFLGVTVERLASILKAGSNLGKRLKKKAGKEARRSGTGGYPK